MLAIPDNHRIIFTEKEIQKRVAELGSTISEDYQDKNPLLVCILRGAAVFMSDLMRNMPIRLGIDYMAVSSYGQSTKSSGVVRILKDLDEVLESRHVLIVEDIVDSGHTLSYLMHLLGARNCASLKVATFLDRPDRREVDVKVNYTGFNITDKFVIGYGMDFNQRHRNTPYIFTLDELPDTHIEATA
jgi:hypoxanthine phosphoribosyltransferase